MTPRGHATFAPPSPHERITLEDLPAPTPATADLLCWLWAATPPRRERLHIARAAAALGVSDTTLRRWIKNAQGAQMPQPAAAKIPRMAQLAVLRGRGQMLWPPLDRNYRERRLALIDEAQRCLTVTQESPEIAPEAWLRPTQLYLVHYPRAHVYGVASGSTKATAAKIHGAGGQIIGETTVRNRHAATLAKAALIDRAGDAHCIPPRSLVPTGRTETWLQSHGPISLRDTLEDDWRP